jgi:hypothetical protein
MKIIVPMHFHLVLFFLYCFGVAILFWAHLYSSLGIVYVGSNVYL